MSEFPGQNFNHLIHEVNALEMKFLGHSAKCSSISDDWLAQNLWLTNYQSVKNKILQSYATDDHVVWKEHNYVIKMQPIIFNRDGESTTDDNFNEVIHEAAIGSILNSMNSKNFARIVCHDFCHTCIPNLLPDIKRYNRCAYVMYKYVPGITLDKYINNCSEIQLCSILYQLFEALFQANKQHNFTHYDLHLENIIVNNTIESKPFPIIVDYGSSYVDLEMGHDVHPLGRELKAGSIHRRPCWQHDVFKICMWLYYQLDPDFVLERLRKELYNRITDIKIIINDMRSRIYPNWYIRKLKKELADEKMSAITNSMNLKIKLQNIENRNRSYRVKILKDDIELQQCENLLKIIKTNPYSIIHQTPFSCCDKISRIISYFIGFKMDRNWFKKYHRQYHYMQLDYDMQSQYYDFEHFLKFSKKLLL